MVTKGKITKHRTGHLYKRGPDGSQYPANSRKHGAFYLQYRINGKTVRQSLHTTDAEEAEQKRLAIMAPYLVANEEQTMAMAVQRLNTVTQQRERLTEPQTSLALDTAWKEFLAAPTRRDTGEATLHQYYLQFARFVQWMKEHHPDVSDLGNVTTSLAEEYVADLSASGMGAGTFNKHVRVLMLVFRILKKKAGIESNPWENISRKRNISQGRRELTSDELSAIIRAATGELHILFAIGIYTGLRLGDCCTLRWSEVDVARGLIMRIPNKTARTSPKPVHIPIHPQLGALLQRLRSTKPRARALLPGRAGTQAETNDRQPRVSSADYVLPETAENYLSNPYAVTTQIQKHFVHCGIRTHKPDTGYVVKENAKGKKRKVFTGKRAVVEVGFHSFRHSFVSLCREANAPLAVVEAIVGHSNPAMTRHYTHVGELAATRAVTALPALITQEAAPAAGAGSELSESEQLKMISEIVSEMTPKTCAKDKGRLLKILKRSKAHEDGGLEQ